MHTPNSKGLYILHQTGLGSPEDGFLRLLPADGRWSWVTNQMQYPSYYPQGLPVYVKTGVDRVDGYDDSRNVPITWTGPPPPPPSNTPKLIHFYRDIQTNQIIEKTVFSGDGNDAFSMTKNNVLSPWSNPNSQNANKQKHGLVLKS